MTAVSVLATAIVLVFAALGTLKVLAVPAMVDRAHHLGFSASAYRSIGALELAGAAGLALGAVVPWIGVAAAVGLLLLMGGAITAHVRNKDGARELVPAVVVTLAVLAYLVLMAVQH